MEACLDQVEAVLSECANADYCDISGVDRVALSLKTVCANLAQYYDEEELCVLLSQISLEFETKLMFLLTSNPSHRTSSLTYGRRGCPRKVINLALVSL